MSRIPSPTQFAKLTAIDQSGMLDYHLGEIEAEIDGLKSGHIWTTNGLTKERALANARARMHRLKMLALDFGHWQEAPVSIRDAAAATCRTPADFKALKRYDKAMEVTSRALLKLQGGARDGYSS